MLYRRHLDFATRKNALKLTVKSALVMHRELSVIYQSAYDAVRQILAIFRDLLR